MPQAITIRNLTKRFGVTTAVEAVDLDVARGEVFGLVGPNGAGKTTLLQLLAALLDPSSGSVSVLGRDIVQDAETLRQRIGYVSQTFTLYGTLSVEENLDFFADLYRVPPVVREQRKEALLAWSRLSPFRQRRAFHLSGGMQKKLHLCCTLIHEPDLLLLDEPTTGVDPVSRRELWEILYDLVGRGLTLVVTTPYMDEAENCHRLGLLHQGQLVTVGSPQALKDRMPAGVMLELECSEPFAALRHLRQQASLARASLFGRHIHMLVEDPGAASSLIHATLTAAGLAVEHLEPIPFSLEDVFVALTDSDAPNRRDNCA